MMQRRDFSKSLALAGATAAWPLAWSQDAAPKAGTDYQKLDKPLATEAGAGRVEVIEFFWYSCPHCNAFEPQLEEWLKHLPKDVSFRRVPVAFRQNNDFVPQQKLYFALESMGKLEALHRKVFQAIHVERQDLRSDEAILNWVVKQGLDKAQFQAQYAAFGMMAKVNRAKQLQDDYKIEGVPSFGIAGRFYTDGTMARSMERALKVTDQLLAQVRKGA